MRKGTPFFLYDQLWVTTCTEELFNPFVDCRRLDTGDPAKFTVHDIEAMRRIFAALPERTKIKIFARHHEELSMATNGDIDPEILAEFYELTLAGMSDADAREMARARHSNLPPEIQHLHGGDLGKQMTAAEAERRRKYVDQVRRNR